jgi:hypothetical protein
MAAATSDDRRGNGIESIHHNHSEADADAVETK